MELGKASELKWRLAGLLGLRGVLTCDRARWRTGGDRCSEREAPATLPALRDRLNVLEAEVDTARAVAEQAQAARAGGQRGITCWARRSML